LASVAPGVAELKVTRFSENSNLTCLEGSSAAIKACRNAIAN